MFIIQQRIVIIGFELRMESRKSLVDKRIKI